MQSVIDGNGCRDVYGGGEAHGRECSDATASADLEEVDAILAGDCDRGNSTLLVDIDGTCLCQRMAINTVGNGNSNRRRNRLVVGEDRKICYGRVVVGRQRRKTAVYGELVQAGLCGVRAGGGDQEIDLPGGGSGDRNGVAEERVLHEAARRTEVPAVEQYIQRVRLRVLNIRVRQGSDRRGASRNDTELERPGPRCDGLGRVGHSHGVSVGGLQVAGSEPDPHAGGCGRRRGSRRDGKQNF